MVDKMSAYSRDASKADLPTYDAGKFKLPVVREETDVEVPSFVACGWSPSKYALEDTLHECEDYRAAILAEAEPGTSGLPMDATQYAFAIAGMKIAWDPPLDPPGGHHYLRWVVAQQPAARREGRDR